jgi:predicted RNA-binding Zn-ribbon protein involved in translation (DUF1610 family)
MNDYMERSITGDVRYEECPQCEASVPAWRGQCLLCGQPTREPLSNDEITEAYHEAGFEGSTYEECPHCETEVELEGEFKVQECPNCKRDILPCSICRDLERTPLACGRCPFDKQPLVDAVIVDLKKGFDKGDYTVLDELLMMLDNESLVQALPEEDWKKFNHLRRDE